MLVCRAQAVLAVVFPTPPLPRKNVSFGGLGIFFGTQCVDEANTKVTKAQKSHGVDENSDFSVLTGFVTFLVLFVTFVFTSR